MKSQDYVLTRRDDKRRVYYSHYVDGRCSHAVAGQNMEAAILPKSEAEKCLRHLRSLGYDFRLAPANCKRITDEIIDHAET